MLAFLRRFMLVLLAVTLSSQLVEALPHARLDRILQVNHPEQVVVFGELAATEGADSASTLTLRTPHAKRAASGAPKHA